MKKAFKLLFLLTMAAASMSLKAQEVTIELYPGWTWISLPITDTLDLTTVFDSFTPIAGDYIKSQAGYAEYYAGYGWYGSLTTFFPGKGYMYKSNRTEPVVVAVDTPLSQQSVTTEGPTDVTVSSAVVGGTVTIGAGNHIFARGVCWGTEPMPDVDDSHTTGATVTGSQTVTLDNLTPNTMYYVRAYMVTDYGLAYGNQQTFTTESGGSGSDHEYVDLGLPSGTLWATCNVGADVPEDYGDYFAWGETLPKEIYDLSTYQYSNGGDWDNPNFTKYCTNSSYGYNGFTDNLTTLLPEDDAATVNWGADWRIPSPEECEELYENTSHTWTTLNGVNGRLFTGPNGNSLFLPAAGACFYTTYNSVGVDGYCWTNSLYTDDPMGAWYFYFFSGNCSVNGGGYRENGISVRAVRSTQPSITEYSIIITPSPAEGGTVTGGGTYQQGQSCTVIATANTGYTFMNWTENNEVVSTDASYTFTVNSDRTLVANFTYNGGGSDHDYVDLGLPSGTLWATCNVGADVPEDYGDYFAWGETTSKSTYNWNTYQYCNGSSTTLTKYCNNAYYGNNGFTDDLTVLQPGDDAATANWWGNWRMPTMEEWQELYQNTTVTQITQNGVHGRLFTASNGNTLFLPSAGYRSGSILHEVSSNGYYWSSSLYTDFPDASWEFQFGSSYYVYNKVRNIGLSVRPVRPGQPGLSYYSVTVSSSPVSGGTVIGGGIYQQGQSCTVLATVNTGYSFANWTENGVVVSTNASYTFTVIGNRSLVANFTYNSDTYVDLGLPSGTLWATCNVGAEVPEEYGYYFAWGEIDLKDYYDWNTYQYCLGSQNNLIKYCNISYYGYNGFTDNLTTLLPEDDAVLTNWGPNWRMPTKEEWQELLQNTTFSWATQNGVFGRRYTASNGNSIFFPAAGEYAGSTLYYADDGDQSRGTYWSSSLNTDNPTTAWAFKFYYTGYGVSQESRAVGVSVRAVRSVPQN